MNPVGESTAPGETPRKPELKMAVLEKRDKHVIKENGSLPLFIARFM